MTTPCIITVAITGSVPRKKDNPALPISVAEQVESTQQAFEAGATLVQISALVYEGPFLPKRLAMGVADLARR